MNFYLIGIDYASVPIEIREAVFRERRNISAFWANLNSQAAILVTCNRFEIYSTVSNQTDIFKDINLFKDKFPKFSCNSYTKIGEKKVFSHALRLASGLESQLKGERQIVEQLERWIAQESFPVNLKALWQKAIVLAQDIRVRSGFNNNENNLARLILDDLVKSRLIQNRIEVIVIGTGKIAQLFASIQHPQFCFSFVAHKNRLKAQQLARQSGGRYISFKELPQALKDAQVLISATSSPHLILMKENIPDQISKRKKPLFIYDLALPRDIDPGVGKIKNVILYNLDNLDFIFQEYNQKIDREIKLAEFLTEETQDRHQEIDNEYDFKGRHAKQSLSLETS